MEKSEPQVIVGLMAKRKLNNWFPIYPPGSPGAACTSDFGDGAGKSTLADVILGVLLPSSGEVKISGLPPLDVVQKWPGAMAYVPQDVKVLSGTVRENVALGIPPEDIDDSLVWEALERVHLADFLSQDRLGIETQVG